MATESHDVAHGAADAAHGAASGGMPQLDFTTYPNQMFWLVVTIVVIYLILSRVALPRIASVLADRQGTITNDIVAAEELKRKAAEAEEAYNTALAEARAEAQRIIAETKAAIQADLDAATAKADAEINAKASESEKKIQEIRDGALESVTIVATDAAQDIVAAFGQTADGAAIADAVSARVKG